MLRIKGKTYKYEKTCKRSRCLLNVFNDVSIPQKEYKMSAKIFSISFSYSYVLSWVFLFLLSFAVTLFHSMIFAKAVIFFDSIHFTFPLHSAHVPLLQVWSPLSASLRTQLTVLCERCRTRRCEDAEITASLYCLAQNTQLYSNIVEHLLQSHGKNWMCVG